MDIAKESAKRLTLEEITTRLLAAEDEIAEIKKRVNTRDKSVGMPDMRNHNTDPGPWTPKAPRPQ